VIGLLLVFLFGAVVIGMTLHDEEAYLNKKFGMDEKDDEDNGKW
jgi:protein-S-isoprenylcysteine O-methyltransferase Ste14